MTQKNQKKIASSNNCNLLLIYNSVLMGFAVQLK